MKTKNLGFYVFLSVLIIVTIITTCIAIFLPDNTPPGTKIEIQFEKNEDGAQVVTSLLPQFFPTSVTFRDADNNEVTWEAPAIETYGAFQSQESFLTFFPELDETAWNNFQTELGQRICQKMQVPDEFNRVKGIAESWYDIPSHKLPSKAFYTLHFTTSHEVWEGFVQDIKSTDEVMANEMALQATFNANGVTYQSIIYMHSDGQTVQYTLYIGDWFLNSFDIQEALISIYHPVTSSVIAHTYLTSTYIAPTDEIYAKFIIGG